MLQVKLRCGDRQVIMVFTKMEDVLAAAADRLGCETNEVLLTMNIEDQTWEIEGEPMLEAAVREDKVISAVRKAAPPAKRSRSDAFGQANESVTEVASSLSFRTPPGSPSPRRRKTSHSAVEQEQQRSTSAASRPSTSASTSASGDESNEESTLRSSKKKWTEKEDGLLWPALNRELKLLPSPNPIYTLEERKLVFDKILQKHPRIFAGRTSEALMSRIQKRVREVRQNQGKLPARIHALFPLSRAPSKPPPAVRQVNAVGQKATQAPMNINVPSADRASSTRSAQSTTQSALRRSYDGDVISVHAVPAAGGLVSGISNNTSTASVSRSQSLAPGRVNALAPPQVARAPRIAEARASLAKERATDEFRPSCASESSIIAQRILSSRMTSSRQSPKPSENTPPSVVQAPRNPEVPAALARGRANVQPRQSSAIETPALVTARLHSSSLIAPSRQSSTASEGSTGEQRRTTDNRQTRAPAILQSEATKAPEQSSSNASPLAPPSPPPPPISPPAIVKSEDELRVQAAPTHSPSDRAARQTIEIRKEVGTCLRACDPYFTTADQMWDGFDAAVATLSSRLEQLCTKSTASEAKDSLTVEETSYCFAYALNDLCARSFQLVAHGRVNSTQACNTSVLVRQVCVNFARIDGFELLLCRFFRTILLEDRNQPRDSDERNWLAMVVACTTLTLPTHYYDSVLDGVFSSAWGVSDHPLEESRFVLSAMDRLLYHLFDMRRLIRSSSRLRALARERGRKAPHFKANVLKRLFNETESAQLARADPRLYYRVRDDTARWNEDIAQDVLFGGTHRKADAGLQSSIESTRSVNSSNNADLQRQTQTTAHNAHNDTTSSSHPDAAAHAAADADPSLFLGLPEFSQQTPM